MYVWLMKVTVTCESAIIIIIIIIIIIELIYKGTRISIFSQGLCKILNYVKR
jgi:hypothetical protein